MSNDVYYVMTGASGRMGQSIIDLSQNYKTAANGNFVLIGAVDTQKSSVVVKNKTLEFDTDPQKLPDKTDVVIDFSSPEFSLKVASICSQKKVPLVTGTTGFSDTQKKQYFEFANQIPMMLSPNMSVGVNLLFELSAIASRILNNHYDIEIVEAHHKYKKDAPSGTAMRLKEIILEELGRSESDVVYGRQGLTGERKATEIAMHTLRGGDVVGDHSVMFLGEGERVELTHRASSRSTFAAGALKAAEFLKNQKPGIYTMRDVLKLNLNRY